MQINWADTPAGIRFADAIEQFCPDPESRILLAVSGGPDSLAMLILAHSICPGRIAAATVDHRLRPEAAQEAAFVARLCAERNIAHCVLTPRHPLTGNIQAAARSARYALLTETADDFSCDVIATAHHSDDQLETVLMRLARGSGLDGLAGIRARNGAIIRPVLGFSKKQLEQICEDAGVSPACDPSNDNDDFDRVAMRQYLAASPHPFDAARSVRTASAIGDAVAALDWMTEQLAHDRIRAKNNEILADVSGLPRELQRRLLLVSLQRASPSSTPRGDAIERLLDKLSVGSTATISDILCKGGPIWRFSLAPPRRTG